MHLTHGYAKEHRPDVQPAVWERMVSQDGGGPGVSQRWVGHTSDTQMFQERAQTVLKAFKTSPSPRDLSADATRDPEDHAAHRRGLGFITRMANTSGVVSHTIEHALTRDPWHAVAETTRDQGVERCHDGLAPRGLVVSSQAALARAEATLNNAKQRDDTALETPRLSTPAAARDALARGAQGWQSHPRASCHLMAHKRDAGPGRPTPRPPRPDPPGHIQAHVRPAADAMGHQQPRKAGGVLGTPIGVSEVSATAVMAAYTRQARVDGGLRGLKEPLVFVSSLWVQKPGRLPGLRMVMT